MTSLIMRSVIRKGRIAKKSLMTMAAICKDIGKPLIHENWYVAPPPPGYIKIEMAGAGVNFGDILQCHGKYQEKRDPPFVPGMECSGKVIEVGEGVDEDIIVGDRVISLGQGVFATHAVVPASSSFVLPRSLPLSTDLTEAAALLVSYGTAHLALTSSGRAKTGETVLITAASGGVGLACVELARELGLKVIAAAGSDEKVSLAVSRGGPTARGFNYTDCDGTLFREKLRAAAGKGGVDVFVDAVGGEMLEAGIRSLNWDGRAVVVGFAGGGVIPKIPANILLVKNVSVNGLYWGAHAKANPALFAESARTIIDMWAAGRIKPHVSHRFSLAEANQAFEVISSRKSTGKVVLVPNLQ